MLARGVEHGVAVGVVGLAADTERVYHEGAFGRRDAAGADKLGPDSVFWLLSRP